MNLKIALTLAAKAYDEKANKDPSGTIEVFHKRVSYSEAAKELRRIVSWVYPALDTRDIVKIVRCRNCAHYKKYKKKNTIKPQVKHLCELDRVQRPPEFFCGNGIDKEV